MAVNWTPQQKEVIESGGCNLLVSAAAGSGKTAVLVARIIDRLTREENPADISRLLVVTFTRAAAAEMRDRIGKGIDDKLKENPGSRHLQHQKLVLQAAQISTIHSLCKTLIQENFETLEIDPSFRMGEENELKILQQEVAADMLEGYYASGNQQFRDFVDRYAGKRADEGIAKLIVDTYDFSRGCAAPEFWLDSCAEMFDSSGETGKYSLERLIANLARETVQSAVSLLQQGMKLILSEHGPIQYEKMFSSDLDQLEPLLAETDYERIRGGLLAFTPIRLAGKSAAGADEEKKELAKELRNQAKKKLNEFSEKFLRESRAELLEETEYLRPSIRMLADLVKEFSRRFAAEKAERGMMDFGDLEHETLRLLATFSKDENGNLTITPTPAADRIAACYDEVICDEYQDSNQVQETILALISGIRSSRNNRFMVGDVKQSIYRFRQADSAIFTEKAEEYASDGQSSRRIDLNQNFRSRLHILEGVNLLFERLMSKETCGITYDEREALVRDPDTLFPDAAGHCVPDRSDMVLIELDKGQMEEEGVTRAELEAAAIAEKILELTDPETGIDIYDGGYRKAEYGDIAILLRSLGETAEMLVRTLSARAIPVSAQVTKGFFETLEIRTMTALMEIIDNPEQDIPAAAVLRAPFVGLTSEELALLRASCPDGSLIAACRSCSQEQPFAAKVHHFLELLDLLRRAADYMEMDEFIRLIYEKTGYYAIAAAMPSGLRRQANLDLLLESAVSFTKGSMCGLFSFVKYLDQIRKNSYDAGEASPDAADKSVKIMTIHKSKGLEFPIVIVGAAGKEFNWQDLSGTALLHREYGIGMDLVNLQTRRKLRSASKRFIAQQLKKETLAEEMRILYVAMTRAKEKLVLVGTADNLEKRMQKWETLLRSGGDPSAVLSAGSYLDWIMPSILQDEQENLFQRECWDTAALIRTLVHRTAFSKDRIDEILRQAPEGAIQEEELAQQLSADAAWQYPWDSLSRIKGKYSVSELKAHLYEADEEAAQLIAPAAPNSGRVPSFMQEEAEKEEKEGYLTGAMRGTAFHLVMELLDFASCPDDGNRMAWLGGEIARMEEAGKLRPEQAKAVYRKGILVFLDSDLGRRMIQAARLGLLHKESQFVMSVPAQMIDPLCTGTDEVVVQGIVDAWFTEENRIIIMDYKTDRVSDDDGEETLRERYARQLEYYARALSGATGLSVAEKWLYSFHLQRQIPISGSEMG